MAAAASTSLLIDPLLSLASQLLQGSVVHANIGYAKKTL